MSIRRTAYTQYNKCMKELVENRPELCPCRHENMKFQARITKTIDYLSIIASSFDELGANNPYTEHAKIIMQQVEELRRIHSPIKARMIYNENEEEQTELERNMSSDIRCDGSETYIPYLLYGCGANCCEESFLGRRCKYD